MENIFREFQCLLFEKNSFVFVDQICHYKAVNQHFMGHKIRFRYAQCSTLKIFNKTIITVNQEFSQTPKRVYKKLQ